MYGPNEDPEDNKVNVAVWTGEDNIEDNKVTPPEGVSLTEHVGTELFTPAVVQEPVVRDARPEEAKNDLVTELKQKAEKINKEDE